MTKQIVIKLNEEKFKPLLDKLIAEGGHHISRTYSEITAKSLFFVSRFLFEKIPELDNKTMREFIEEARDFSPEQGLIDMLSSYSKFLSKE